MKNFFRIEFLKNKTKYFKRIRRTPGRIMRDYSSRTSTFRVSYKNFGILERNEKKRNRN